MKLKTTIFAGLTALAASMTFAAANTAQLDTEIKIVNAGSDSGTFRQILNMMGEYFNHSFIQAGSPEVAGLNYTGENILTVWSSEYPANSTVELDVNQENLVALMVYETLVCSREFNSFAEMNGQTVQIATWGNGTTSRYVEKLGEQHNINFEVVPYNGSGAITQGYLGKDADTVLNITSRQPAMEEDSATNCFAFSARGDLDFAFVDAVVSVNAEAEITQSLRQIAETMSQTTEFQDSFKGLSFKVATDDNQEQLIADYETAVINFTAE